MPENNDLKSRFEIYLESALNSLEVDGLPKPISRGDEYLLALIAKLTETNMSIENIESTLTETILSIENIDSVLSGLSWIPSVTPEAHRNIFRGKNLGTVITPEQKQAISSGTFDDLFIGDYWTINGTVYVIADMNYWLNTGDTSFNKQHLVMVTRTNMYNHVMNDENTTTGGYVGSKMYTEGLNQAKTTIREAFGEMLLTHRDYLINAVSGGYSSAGAWFDSTVELMNEIMVYGSHIYTPGSTGSLTPTRYTINKQQLALYNLDPKNVNNRQYFWLRDIVTSANFAYVSSSGAANHGIASHSNGVRPVFAIG